MTISGDLDSVVSRGSVTERVNNVLSWIKADDVSLFLESEGIDLNHWFDGVNALIGKCGYQPGAKSYLDDKA